MIDARMTMGVGMFLAACGGGAATSSASATTTATTAGTLTFADALARTEAAHPGAQAFEVEYEEHGGQRVVEVEVLSGGTVHAVFYDPASGEVLDEADETPEADEAAGFPTIRAAIDAGTVSMRSALELASTRHPEGVEAVEIQVENGTAIVAVLVRDATGTTRFVHDPTTGDEIAHGAGSAEHAE